MRHLVANIFTYVLAALLLGGSLAFAWIRSAQLVVSDEAAVLACADDTPASARRWATLGERSYVANCRNCHGPAGLGWDQYPPVVGLIGVASLPGGRDYLIALHLWGVASDRWRAPMPPMGHLQNLEIAAVINYVLFGAGRARPDGVAEVDVAEVGAARRRPLSPHEVARLRP